MMLITRTSLLTGRVRTRDLDVTAAQLQQYAETRALIQQVFPHLSDDDREFLKTGITAEEWEAQFGREE